MRAIECSFPQPIPGFALSATCVTGGAGNADLRRASKARSAHHRSESSRESKHAQSPIASFVSSCRSNRGRLRYRVRRSVTSAAAYRRASRQCIHDEQHDQSAVGLFSKVLGQRAVLHRAGAQVKILALAFALALSGCAVMPNDISPEIVHTSHAVQHFGATPTNFGANIAQLTARWNLPHNFISKGQRESR